MRIRDLSLARGKGQSRSSEQSILQTPKVNPSNGVPTAHLPGICVHTVGSEPNSCLHKALSRVQSHIGATSFMPATNFLDMRKDVGAKHWSEQ